MVQWQLQWISGCCGCRCIFKKGEKIHCTVMCGVIAVHVQESTLFFSHTVRDLVCLLFNFDSKIWVCNWVVNHALVMKLAYFRWLEQVFWKFSVQLWLHLDNIVKFVHEMFIDIFPWTNEHAWTNEHEQWTWTLLPSVCVLVLLYLKYDKLKKYMYLVLGQ